MVLGTGNQFFAHSRPEDGYTIVKDPASGEWRFAEPAAGGVRLTASDPVAGRDTAAATLTPHLRPSKEAAKAEAAEAHVVSGRRRWEERRAERELARQARPPGARPLRRRRGRRLATMWVSAFWCEFPDEPGTIASPRPQLLQPGRLFRFWQ